MDYKKIYDELIAYRQSNIPSGYTEKHHIQMRSLGGTDDEWNLVKLTSREHYIIHLLLARFNRCSQTACALWMMQCKNANHEVRPAIKNSRMYEWARKEFAKYISRNNKITSNGERNSQHGTCWICNIDLKENKKILKTDELPQGWIPGRNKWKVYPKLSKEEMREVCRRNGQISKGRKLSEQTRQRMSEQSLNSGRSKGIRNGMFGKYKNTTFNMPK